MSDSDPQSATTTGDAPPAPLSAGALKALLHDPRRSRRLAHLAVYAFYLILAARCLEPIFGTLDTHLTGAPQSDVLRNVWGYGWVKAMLIDQLSLPRFTRMLNYPSGMTILVIDLLGCLVSLPFQLIFGMPAGYNLLVVATLAFNAWAGFALAWDRSRSAGAALVAGAMFGLCPYVLSSAIAGNSELINVGWLALYLRAFLRIVAPMRGEESTSGVGAGLLLAATTLSCWYYGYIVGVATVVLLLVTLPVAGVQRRPMRRTLKALAVHWGVFGAFCLVMIFLYRDIIPSVRETTGALQQSLEMVKGDSLRLWELIQPETSRWDKPLLFHFPLPLLACLPIAFLLGLPRSLRWAPVLGLFLLLSMAYADHLPLPAAVAERSDRLVGAIERLPFDRTSMEKVLRPIDAFTPGFYKWWLGHFPLASIIRFPSRHMTVVNLSLALIMALGLGRLLTIRPWMRWPGVALGLILAVSLTGEMAAAGHYDRMIETTDVSPPAWVQRVAADPEPGAIAQLPVEMGGGQQIFYQIYHHRPLMAWVNFVTARIYYITDPHGTQLMPMSFLSTVYAIQQRGYDKQAERWPNAEMWLPEPDVIEKDVAGLAFAGFRYLVIDTTLYRPDDMAVIRPTLDKYLIPEEPDGATLIWRVPPQDKAAE